MRREPTVLDYHLPQLAVGLGVLLTGSLLGCQGPSRADRSLAQGVQAEGPVLQLDRAGERERLPATDPLAFLEQCHAHYRTFVTDYRCLFTMRERTNGVLSPEQGIEVRYRENPFSVHLRWVRNPRRAAWVKYVAGRWAKDGREHALVKPSGVLGWLVPAGVKRHIHAPEMLAASRRPIDRFGFRNTLELIIQYCQLARGDPEYELRYVGSGSVDGRPCYVLERRLPYAGPDGPYPDRLLVMYLDREWMVPTACLSYLDDAGQELLGSYILTDVQFNVGLSDADF